MDCVKQDNCLKSDDSSVKFIIEIDKTNGCCPAGEKRGDENLLRNAIPVLSCEGACIRGEIARFAANLISKEEGYARGCHGEFLTVPDSAIGKWIRAAEKVVVVDGCFLKCHNRIFKNILDESKICSFDALSFYGKYTEYFDPDSVPEEELRQVAADVAGKIITDLGKNIAISDKTCCSCS
jgi:uncharacterized metal-binding protein